MPVVAAGELDDARPAGDPAGEPDGAHRRLGARVDQPHLLDGRDPPDDLLGELDLGGGRRAERQPVARGRPHGLDDGGVRVTEDHRPPRADEVDVAVTVGVGEPRAAGRDHEPRRAAHGGEGADGRVDPARDRGGGAGEQGAGGVGAELGDGGRGHGPSLPQDATGRQQARQRRRANQSRAAGANINPTPANASISGTREDGDARRVQRQPLRARRDHRCDDHQHEPGGRRGEQRPRPPAPAPGQHPEQDEPQRDREHHEPRDPDHLREVDPQLLELGQVLRRQRGRGLPRTGHREQPDQEVRHRREDDQQQREMQRPRTPRREHRLGAQPRRGRRVRGRVGVVAVRVVDVRRFGRARRSARPRRLVVRGRGRTATRGTRAHRRAAAGRTAAAGRPGVGRRRGRSGWGRVGIGPSRSSGARPSPGIVTRPPR